MRRLVNSVYHNHRILELEVHRYRPAIPEVLVLKISIHLWGGGHRELGAGMQGVDREKCFESPIGHEQLPGDECSGITGDLTSERKSGKATLIGMQSQVSLHYVRDLLSITSLQAQAELRDERST